MVVFGCRHAEKGVVCWRVGSLVRVGGLLLCAGLAAVVCCWWACVAVEWCVVLLVAGLVVVCLVLKAPVPLRPFFVGGLGAGAFNLFGWWRCPALPHPGGCSTIGAGRLSFQVRNGCWAFPYRYDHHQN